MSIKGLLLNKYGQGHYKQHPVYTNYWIVDNGEVWSETLKHPISQTIMPSGYHRVVLSYKNRSVNFLVHRLVGELFIPNPENKPCINHKDCNPHNNNASNLEWVTHKENNNYGNHGRLNGLAHSIPVHKIDKNTNKIIKTYPSMRAAAEDNHIKASNIGAVCANKTHYITAGGYKWAYAEGGGVEE